MIARIFIRVSIVFILGSLKLTESLIYSKLWEEFSTPPSTLNISPLKPSSLSLAGRSRLTWYRLLPVALCSTIVATLSPGPAKRHVYCSLICSLSFVCLFVLLLCFSYPFGATALPLTGRPLTIRLVILLLAAPTDGHWHSSDNVWCAL